MEGSFSWLPDNRRIVLAGRAAAAGGTHLWVADLQKDSIRPITQGISEEAEPAVPPDGNSVVFTSLESHWNIVEVSLGDFSERSLLSTSHSEFNPAWSPENNQFAYVTDRNGTHEIWIKQRTQNWGKPLITGKELEGKTYSIGSPGFSPDGQRIAFQRRGNAGSGIYVATIVGGPPIQLTPADGGESPTWSPDGNWIAYVSNKNGKFGLVKARVGGSGKSELLKDSIRNDAPQWSPTGNWISCQSNEGLLLVSANGKESRLLSKELWLAHGWSKDGTGIYGIRQTNDGRFVLAIIDGATGTEKNLSIMESSFAADGPRGFSLSPDGLSFATSVKTIKGDLWLLENLMR